MWYPGRSARNAPKGVTAAAKAALNAQKSAEAIVPWGEKKLKGRAEPMQAGVIEGRRTA